MLSLVVFSILVLLAHPSLVSVRGLYAIFYADSNCTITTTALSQYNSIFPTITQQTTNGVFLCLNSTTAPPLSSNTSVSYYCLTGANSSISIQLSGYNNTSTCSKGTKEYIVYTTSSFPINGCQAAQFLIYPNNASRSYFMNAYMKGSCDTYIYSSSGGTSSGAANSGVNSAVPIYRYGYGYDAHVDHTNSKLLLRLLFMMLVALLSL